VAYLNARAALVCSVLGLSSLYAGAQQTLGGIVGTVTDSSGGVLPGVAVVAVDEGTQLTRTAQSNSSGDYSFPNLPIGTYTVTFTRDGFSTARFPGLVIQADRTITLPAQMATGSVTEAVTVEAVPLLNAVDTTNGYVLDKAQIESIPLPTGSFTGLAILSPGVNAELPGGTGSNSGMGNAPIWANGQRDTSNSFLLNGVDGSNLFNGKSTSQVNSARVVNNTGEKKSAGGTIQSAASVYLSIGNALPTPAPESLAEVRVNASMYDASQGSTSGAHLDLSTGSGTNDIHGSAYWHRGTSWLNAAPFFFNQDPNIPASEKVPDLNRYVAGFAFGGPIIKDKLFGFLAYQHQHVADQEIGISRLDVPIGLTDDRSAAGLAALANTNYANEGTNISPAQISPVALFLFQHPSLPGEPGKYLIPDAGSAPSVTAQDDATIPGTSRFTADQVVADLDWNASKTDTLSAKYYYQHDPAVSPYGYSDIPGFDVHMDTGSHVFALTNTSLVKPNLSIVETLGFVREKVYGVNEQPFTSQDAGINSFGSTYFPGIQVLDILGDASPGFDIGLGIGAGATTQAAFTGVFQNRINPSANAIWTLGKHTVTFGGSYSYSQLNVRDERTNKGMIAVSSFASFLLGDISTQNNNYTTTTFLLGDANRYYRTNQVGTYVQDKFQIMPTLSLTAGIRYDWNGGFTEKYGRIFNFDPSLYSYNEGSGTVASNGFIIAGNNAQATKGVSNTTLTGRQWGIAPRIGAAWQPARFGGKVVVRAGTGIYYDRGELFTYFSPGYAAGETTGGPFGVNQSPPFVNSVQCNVNNAGTALEATAASPCTPDSSGTYTLSNPWGTTVGYQPTGKASDINNYLPSAAAIINGAQLFSLGTYDRANKLPYTINFTLDVQWQPRNDLAITLGYVGNLGRHEVVPVPFNQAGIASPSNPIHGQNYTYGYTVQTANAPECLYSYYPGCSPANLPDGTPYLGTYEGGNIDLRVPYVGYSAESETYKAAGVSQYQALQAHVEKRLSHGLQVGFSYTYSHALDEQSGIGLFYNGNNPRDGYASSDFDRTHVFNFDYIYHLPNAVRESTLVGKVVDGWALQGLTVIQSGQPYSVIDYSGAVGSIYYGTADGITNPIVPLAPGCTAKNAKTGKSGAFTDGGANVNEYALKASCFTIPLYSPGDLQGGIPSNDTFETGFTSGQRNIFRQAYQKRADASLVKTFSVTERYHFKYTFDVFNLTNTTSFDIPTDNVSQNGSFIITPVIGQPLYNAPVGLGATVNAIGSARQIQMSLGMQF
jgi:hypothetical protein